MISLVIAYVAISAVVCLIFAVPIGFFGVGLSEKDMFECSEIERDFKTGRITLGRKVFYFVFNVIFGYPTRMVQIPSILIFGVYLLIRLFL